MLEPEQTGVQRNPVPVGGTLRTAAGIVSGQPALLRYDRSHPQTLSPDEIDRFVSQLTATKHRDRAIVWLLKDGGVRIGEALPTDAGHSLGGPARYGSCHKKSYLPYRSSK
ncbi:MAG: hypothetical protein IPQ00_02855 [Chloracidobacterium sp.]|nr:hypothetical protein [Chloracidobacterium sp.]